MVSLVGCFGLSISLTFLICSPIIGRDRQSQFLKKNVFSFIWIFYIYIYFLVGKRHSDDFECLFRLFGNLIKGKAGGVHQSLAYSALGSSVFASPSSSSLMALEIISPLATRIERRMDMLRTAREPSYTRNGRRIDPDDTPFMAKYRQFE